MHMRCGGVSPGSRALAVNARNFLSHTGNPPADVQNSKEPPQPLPGPPPGYVRKTKSEEGEQPQPLPGTPPGSQAEQPQPGLPVGQDQQWAPESEELLPGPPRSPWVPFIIPPDRPWHPDYPRLRAEREAMQSQEAVVPLPEEQPQTPPGSPPWSTAGRKSEGEERPQPPSAPSPAHLEEPQPPGEHVPPPPSPPGQVREIVHEERPPPPLAFPDVPVEPQEEPTRRRPTAAKRSQSTTKMIPWL